MPIETGRCAQVRGARQNDFEYEDITLDAPECGDVRLRLTAIGLNSLATYHRSGAYPLPLPSGLSFEAAGVVEAVGDGVTDIKVGDRVASGAGPSGSYAQARNMPANRLAKPPETIPDETAAAMMLTGIRITTADFAHPEVDDVFDDLGEIVLKKRGEVIVVRTDRMPTNSGAAAIYRF